MTCYHVILRHEASSSRRLSQSISLLNRTTEADLQEVNYLLVDWCRSRDHLTNVSTKHTSSLTKEKRIVATMAHSSSSLEVCLLGGQTAVEQPSFASCKSVESSFECAIDLIIESGNRWEDHRLQYRTILYELNWVSLVETDLEAFEESISKQSLLKRMREGQVRDDGLTSNQVALLGSSLSG